MYFWKIDRLKEDHKSEAFTEKDRFIYAFIYIAIGVIGFEFMMYVPIENPNFWDKINSTFSILIPLLGTYLAYKANGAHIGSDFLGRYFSISFVVVVRSCLLLIPIAIILLVYYLHAFPADEVIVSTPMDTIPFLLWQTFIYCRVCKHISDVRST